MMTTTRDANLNQPDYAYDRPLEAHGVKGLKSTPWRKTFKTSAALLKWCERNEAVVHGTRDLEVTR